MNGTGPLRTRPYTKGFTLLELSIVLVIIALVTGMAVQSGISVVETARLTATQKKMKAIEDALMQYRTANDRLPCPADLTITPGSANYGLEAGADGASIIGVGRGICTGPSMVPHANFTGTSATNTFATAAEGALPAVTLGLSPDFMYDGWGNQFRYAVDISMTAQGAFPNVNIGCTDGAVTVNDANGNARSTGSIYALISHGANGHGAYTRNGVTVNVGSVNANELANCHCNSSGTATAYAPTYVQMQQTLDPSNALDNFDDLVSYKERWQMQTNWDKTGRCVYVYVTDSGNNRVEIFSTSGAYVSQFGSTGSGNGQFSGPVGIALDSSGNIWVVDNGNGRVQEFSSGGNYLSQFGTSGSGAGQFSDANGISFDASGNIWVVNGSGNNAIQEFNTSGSYRGYIGTYGSGNGQLYNPQEVRFISGSNLWVADSQNYRIEEFTSAGAYVNQFGSQGTGNGQFGGGTQGIAIDGSGNIWATDWSGCRVEKFNSSGTYVSQFGSCGTGNGQFDSFANDINIDGSGNIWVSSTTRVQKFDSNGNYLLQLGCASGSCSTGSGNGQFNSPNYIAFGSR